MKRSLLLNGFMATGKSTVGRRVAERAAVPFVDLDEAIERSAGKSVAELFRLHGEPGFRKLERAELEAQLARPGVRVIALGGGALLSRTLRLHALQRAVVITLQADLETLLQRAQGGPERPLLQGGDTRHVETLLELRRVAYAEAHECLDVSALDPDQVAAQVLAVWQRDPVAVAAGLGSYSVEVGHGFAKERAANVVQGAANALLITDKTVGKLYGKGYLDALTALGVNGSTFELEPGEEHKTPASLSAIWEHCLQMQADRKTWFLGVGGGVVTDVAGFAAATWMRGVSWVSVPTTLLGMVDASVGGKTAVDLPGAKNCVGAFWQPSRVLCDVAHLQSEAVRGRVSALAEVVKTALIGDPEMFEQLEDAAGPELVHDLSRLAEWVRRSIVVKARVVSEDERETGFRAALNLGHTVGHALEAYGGFGGLTHGEAISLGLVAALRLGAHWGVTPGELARRTERLLGKLGLPVDLGARPLAQAAELLGHDKKRGGQSVRFVLCSAIGQVEFRKVGLEELKQRVQALKT